MTQMALGDLKKWKMYQIRSHAHVWTKSQKLVFSVPFWPFCPFCRSKWVKMAQNYFFMNSEAKRFPTRGHTPMFEQNLKIWDFRSLLALFGPFFGPNVSKWPEIIFFWILRPNDFQWGVICLCLKKTSKNDIFGPFLTFFGPFFGPNGSKWPKIIFFWILRPNDFQRGVICLCLVKTWKNDIFGPFLTLFGPFFGPNWSKWPKIIFFWILRPNDFQRGVTCQYLNKISKNGTFGPKMGYRAQKKPKNDFFQKMKKTSPGNIPNFRKTQENNIEDHPGT